MNHLLKRVTLFTLFSIFCLSTYAQYGNEWINTSQTYFKIKIDQVGIYKIGQPTLANLGADVSSINPKNIQVYRDGIEQSIRVVGQADGTFDAIDYIEFFAQPNDGSFDVDLFEEDSLQGNKYTSLYNDAAVYFITWSASDPGLRLTDYYDNDYTNATDDWFWHTSIRSFQNLWYDGVPYATAGFSSEYTTGEGWYSQAFWATRELQLDVSSPMHFAAGPDASFELYGGGKSNPENTVGGMNHEMTVKVGASKSLLLQKQFYGYGHFKMKGSIATSDVGTTTTPFYFSSTLLDRGRQAISYIKLDYPRTYDLQNMSTFGFNNFRNNRHIQFENYSPTKNSPRILDLKTKEYIKGDLVAGDLHFNLSVSDSQYVYIYDSTDVLTLSSSEILEVSHSSIDLSETYDYVILSNKKLQSGAEQYRDYRESIAGGGHTVLLVYTDEVYNDFSYGYHHPLGLKRLCEYLRNELTEQPDFMLLLGKGRKYDVSKEDATLRVNEDLVPTFGWPGSDILYSADLENHDFAAGFATGRVPCKSNTDVEIYLNKVKEHENDSFSSPNYIQMTGGSGAQEQELLQNRQEQYFKIVESSGVVTNKIAFEKTSNPIIDTTFRTAIPSAIGNGASVLSIFAHGASQIIEIDWGDISTWNNKGKYPLIIGGGQSLGDVYGGTSLLEELFFTADNGAIATFAPTSFYFIDPIYNWTSILHQNIYADHANESLGEQHLATLSDYQNPVNLFNKSQCLQMNFYGDPALKVYHQYQTASLERNVAHQNQISVYPNPSSGIVHFTGDGIKEIQVMNSIGKQVLHSSIDTIDLSNLSRGTYFVIIQSIAGISYHKILLN